jgi:hypothetical protein
LPPNQPVVILADAGHLCNIESPGEFNSTVRTFLHGHMFLIIGQQARASLLFMAAW